jgi:hypothetical protein
MNAVMFALNKEPIDYQLTIHIHNYGTVDQFISHYEYVSKYMDRFYVQQEMPGMYGLIQYYSKEKIDEFITTFKLRKEVV